MTHQKLKVLVITDKTVALIVCAFLSVEIVYLLIWSVVDPMTVVQVPDQTDPSLTKLVCYSVHGDVWAGIFFAWKVRKLIIWLVYPLT